MNKLIIRSLVFTVLLLTSVSAWSQGNTQVIDIALSRPGEPVTLDIDILSARIEVIGEDRNDAQIDVAVDAGERKIITPSGTQQIKAASFSFEVEEDDNEISVDTDWRADRASIVARIPNRADLSLHTVNDGELIVSNITGNLELNNVNGPITATGITGSVIAESVNNTIDVSFLRLDEDNASAFETINGDLYVRLPTNLGAEIHLDTARGEMYSDFEVDVVPNSGNVTRENSRNGTIVRIDNVVVVNVNGGGPVVRLKSLNGDIHILKAGQ